MTIPLWWLVVSGAFFVVGIVLAALLAVLSLRLLEMVRRLQVQIDP